MPTKLTRRTVLRGGAGCMIGLPLLDGMRVAKAQAAAPARFITYHQPFSMFADAFWPPEPGKSQYDVNSGKIDLWPRSGDGFLDNPDPQLSAILKKLEPIKKEILILEGLQNAGNNHDGYCSILNGYEPVEQSSTEQTGGGISLDHYMAQKLGFDKTMRYPNLQVGVMNNFTGSKGAVSWTAKGQAAPAEDNPRNLFNKLFPNGASTQPGTMNPMSAEMLHAQQKSVLDAAIGQATALRTQLSRLDQEKLDQYLTAFRSVEERISVSAAPTIGCMPPSGLKLDYSVNPDSGNNDSYLAEQPNMTKDMIELMAMAFACDLTRIITFQMCTEGNNLVFSWLPNQRGRWHDLSHIWLEPGQAPYQADPMDPTSMSWTEDVNNFIAMCDWNTEQVFNLQDALKRHGVFDNTLLLWTTNMSQGNYHASINIPLVLIGNVNKYFRMGRHLRLDNGANFDGGSYRVINDLLVTLLNAYGVPDTTFGDPMLCRGALKDIVA